jgi:hypothetical protein
MKRVEWLMIVVNNHGAEERPKGSTSEREHFEAVKNALPLETEERVCGLGHLDVRVSAGNSCGAAVVAALEQGATLPLEGLHLELALPQVSIHVTSVPDQTSLAHAVQCNPEGEDAYEG